MFTVNVQPPLKSPSHIQMSSLIPCEISVFSEKLITDFRPAEMRPNDGLLLISDK